MTYNELRIGNLVLYGNDVVEITAINKTTIYDKNGFAPIIDHKPIILSENWLINFGFKLGDDIHTNKHFMFMEFPNSKRYFTYNINQKMMCIHDSYNLIVENPTPTPVIQVPVNAFLYVHQLQNLYYSLTFEELILNNCEAIKAGGKIY